MSVRLVAVDAWGVAELDPSVPRAFARDALYNLAEMDGVASVTVAAVFNTPAPRAAAVAAMPADERVPESVRGKPDWKIELDKEHSEPGSAAEFGKDPKDAHGATVRIHVPRSPCRIRVECKTDLGMASLSIWFVRGEITLRTSGEVTMDDARNPTWRTALRHLGVLPAVPPAQRAEQRPGGRRWPTDLHPSLGEEPTQLGLRAWRHRYETGANRLGRPGTRFAAVVEIRGVVRPASLGIKLFLSRRVTKDALANTVLAEAIHDGGGVHTRGEVLERAWRDRFDDTTAATVHEARPNAQGEVFELDAPGYTFAAARHGEAAEPEDESQTYCANYEEQLSVGDPDRYPMLWSWALSGDHTLKKKLEERGWSTEYPGPFWAARMLGLNLARPMRWYCALDVTPDGRSYPEDGTGWTYPVLKFSPDCELGVGDFEKGPLGQRNKERVTRTQHEWAYHLAFNEHDGQPVPSAEFVAVFPNGDMVRDKLDANGRMTLWRDVEGAPKVYYPFHATQTGTENPPPATTGELLAGCCSEGAH